MAIIARCRAKHTDGLQKDAPCRPQGSVDRRVGKDALSVQWGAGKDENLLQGAVARCRWNPAVRGGGGNLAHRRQERQSSHVIIKLHKLDRV